MDDDVKRRIAEVIARTVFGNGTAHQSRLFTYLTSHPASEHDDPMRASGGFEVAWWTVMDWVEAKGWDWEKHGGVWEMWSLDFPDDSGFKASIIGRGERWVRLSCVAQAIEAGALKQK